MHLKQDKMEQRMTAQSMHQERWWEKVPKAGSVTGGGADFVGILPAAVEADRFGGRNIGGMMALLLLGLAMLMVSCQKDPLKDLMASESRIYITNYDSTADFRSFASFSIADSVGVIEDNRGLGKELTTYDAAVIAAVRGQMEARGYQEVARGDNPDLGITVSRVYNNYTGLISYPAYWDRYGSFYDPFYWGYGGYNYYSPMYYGPTFYSTYQVTQGALTVDILNLKDAETDNSIHPVWSALSRGSGTFNAVNVESLVKAFFDQSPYLSTAP